MSPPFSYFPRGGHWLHSTFPPRGEARRPMQGPRQESVTTGLTGMGPTISPQAGRHCQAGVFTWVTSSVGSAGARTARAARASRTANLSHFISVDRRAACFASLWSDARPVATYMSCRLTLVVRCSWFESSWVLGLFARPFCLRSICRSAAFCCSLRLLLPPVGS